MGVLPSTPPPNRSTTKTSAEAESITVLKGQAGNMNLADNFYLSTGNLKINYGSKKSGHFIWFVLPPPTPAT